MIAFLRGIVQERSEEALFMEVNGVGFRILMADSALQQVKLGDELLIYTYLVHREDAMLLYGFLNQADKALFIKLINVSGVGPKTALGVLSLFSAAEFCQAVLNEDAKLLSKAPGIGLKTAQRLILELKTAFTKEAKQFAAQGGINLPGNPQIDDAVAALEALGYDPVAAVKAVKEARADNPESGLQQIVKTALRLLMKE